MRLGGRGKLATGSATVGQSHSYFLWPRLMLFRPQQHQETYWYSLPLVFYLQLSATWEPTIQCDSQQHAQSLTKN